MYRQATVALVALMGAAAVCPWVSIATDARAASEVNVYSYRQSYLIQPVFDAFTKKTGIRVNVVFGKQGLLERLKAEGMNSPADMLFTAGVGILSDAVAAGALQPIRSPVLESSIPAPYRHKSGYWFGLTLRARIIYASRERVKPGELTTYEQLADSRWRGRICSRSSNHSYNVALMASLIAHHGMAEAEAWARAVAGNLARKPQGNDRAQIRAVAEGICDVALGNSYYMGKMLEDPKQAQWTREVTLLFPNQQGRGVHVNISGAGITRGAKNRAAAIALLEFLVSDGAQELYAQGNYEYPVKAGVPWSDTVASWGRFKADALPLTQIADNRANAVKAFDRAGFP